MSDREQAAASCDTSGVTLFVEATQARVRGDLSAALRLGRRALSALERETGPESPAAVAALLLLGETAIELAPWVGVCPVGHTAYRHRRPSRATSCVKCAPRFDSRHLFTWTRREISPAARLAAMTPRG